MDRKVKSLVLIFILLIILLYAALSIKEFISNKFLVSLIVALLAVAFFGLFLMLNKEDLPNVSGKSMLRYSLLCHNCNWEWMSNTTEKEKPTTCPNCGNKSKLELIGWRKVHVLPKKGDKELSNFFKR